MDDDQINEHVGRQLRRRRRALGLTQPSLAAACGVTFQQIQKYECGASRLTVARLWLLARALEVPMSYFFDGLHHAAGAAAATPELRLIRGC